MNLHIHHFPIVPTHAMSSISSNTPSSVPFVNSQTGSQSFVAAVTYPPPTASSFPISVSPDGNPYSDAQSITVTMTPPTTIPITTRDDKPGDEGTLGADDVRIDIPTGLSAELGEEGLKRLRGDVKALYAEHLNDARPDPDGSFSTFLAKVGEGIKDILLSFREIGEAVVDGTTETFRVVTGQAAFDQEKWPEYTVGTIVSTLVIVILVNKRSVRLMLTHLRRTSPLSSGAGSDIELELFPPEAEVSGDDGR